MQRAVSITSTASAAIQRSRISSPAGSRWCPYIRSVFWCSQLNVKAFDPKTVRKSLRFIISESEKLFSSVSDTARSEVLRDVESAVVRTKARFGNTQVEVRTSATLCRRPIRSRGQSLRPDRRVACRDQAEYRAVVDGGKFAAGKGFQFPDRKPRAGERAPAASAASRTGRNPTTRRMSQAGLSIAKTQDATRFLGARLYGSARWSRKGED